MFYLVQLWQHCVSAKPQPLAAEVQFFKFIFVFSLYIYHRDRRNYEEIMSTFRSMYDSKIWQERKAWQAKSTKYNQAGTNTRCRGLSSVPSISWHAEAHAMRSHSMQSLVAKWLTHFDKGWVGGGGVGGRGGAVGGGLQQNTDLPG